MSGRQRRVLIVAFHYPPDLSSSGVLRTLKFSRYLLDEGWQPTVLTVRPEMYETVDGALEQQIPAGVEVHRTFALDMKRTFSIRGKHLRATVVPDRFTGWIPFSVRRGRKLIRDKQIDAIFSTSPMPSAHLVALRLHRLTGVPWIADFRDPWLEPELSDTSSLLYRFEASLHRRVLRSANRLVFTTAQLADYVLREHPDLRNKAAVIPNGYDEADFSGAVTGEPAPGKIVITHTGLVDGAYRSPAGVLAALSSAIEAGEVDAREICLKFLGPGSYPQSAEFQDVLRRLRLEEIVVTTGKISYAECLAEQARSHILLLLQCGDDTRTLIPAKAFEYLRVGRPILAVTPEGATSELFAKTGGAMVVHPSDQAGMCTALSELIASARRGDIKAAVDREALAAYSRRNLTRRLAQELDAITSTESLARKRGV